MNYLLQRAKSLLLPHYLSSRCSILERRRWRRAGLIGNCRVFYGHERILGRGDIVSGGKVKFLDLQEAFPNCPDSPNLLYLLTNYLPPRWDIMLRSARKNGAKVVLNQNGVAYPAWHGPGWEDANAPMAFLLKEADHVFYQSNFCKVSADHFIGKREHGFEVLYNPVDTKHFVPKYPDGRLGCSELRLLTAGSFNERYRVRAVLQVLKGIVFHIPNARLIIAGRLAWRSNGALAENEMFEIAGALGIQDKVKFIGAYSQNDALKIYQNCHILVHTTYNDCCPRVVVEAMSCGLPVVYSSSGGLPEIVGEEAGIGIPAPLDWNRIHEPDPQLMAQAIVKIASAYFTFSLAARRVAVERFDVRPWVRRHEEVFKKLLCQGRL